jgi:hypothetical protein
MSKIEDGSVKIRGRSNNSITLEEDKSINLTVDEGENNVSIDLDAIDNTLKLLADEIVLISNLNNTDENSLVYGEKLVEILKWIIKVLKTHTHMSSHPGTPGSPALPAFHAKADNYYINMEKQILNKNIRMK